MTSPHPPKPINKRRSQTSPQEERLWGALEEVVDPEFPVSVVDMGLIYDIEKQDHTVNVRLTFTSMGCPAMEFIIEDIRKRLLQELDVDQVDIEIVWDPPWTRSRLSPKAIEKLKSWGVGT